MSRSRRNRPTRPATAAPPQPAGGGVGRAAPPAVAPVRSPPQPQAVRLGRRDLWAPAGVVAVALVVFVMTTARDITVGDNPEFVGAALNLGVGHPPGYPLAAMLGHLFSWLPVGPPAFRVNLLAAVCGAGAAGFTVLTALRLTGNPLAAAVAGLALAFNPLFWRWSLEAEAFPLNNLIVSAMLFLALSWHQRPRERRWLVAAALVGGLGMANHHTVVLCAPAIFFLMARRASYLLARPSTLVLCAVAFVMGMTPYLYIGWAAARDPFFNWGDVGYTKDLVGLFLRRDYGTGQLVAGAADAGSPWLRLLALAESFSPLEGVLLVAGACYAWFTLRWYLWFVLLAFLPAGPGFAAYANIDVASRISLFVLERFFLLPHVIVAPLAALGLLGLVKLVQSRVPRVSGYPLVPGLAGVSVAVVALAAVATYPTVDLSNNRVARTYAEDVLASIPQGAIFLADGDYLTLPIAYLQGVEGARPDVRLVYFGVIKGAKWYVDQLRRRDPALVIPFDRYDARAGHLRQFADANRSRPLVAFVGPSLDFQGRYWYLRRGLVDEVLPMEKDVEVTELKTELNKAFAQYRIPDAATLRRGTFEEPILRAYTLAAKRAGDAFKDVGLKADARQWYEKGLAIDPEALLLKEALDKLDEPASGQRTGSN